MRNDCRTARAVLAEGPLCKVEGCECGTVHVSIGPLTVRLRPEAVESIWATLGEAIAGLSDPLLRAERRRGRDTPRSKAQLS